MQNNTMFVTNQCSRQSRVYSVDGKRKSRTPR